MIRANIESKFFLKDSAKLGTIISQLSKVPTRPVDTIEELLICFEAKDIKDRGSYIIPEGFGKELSGLKTIAFVFKTNDNQIELDELLFGEKSFFEHDNIENIIFKKRQNNDTNIDITTLPNADVYFKSVQYGFKSFKNTKMMQRCQINYYANSIVFSNESFYESNITGIDIKKQKDDNNKHECRLTISDKSFFRCAKLTDFSLNKDVNIEGSLGEEAFHHCANLKRIDLNFLINDENRDLQFTSDVLTCTNLSSINITLNVNKRVTKDATIKFNYRFSYPYNPDQGSTGKLRSQLNSIKIHINNGINLEEKMHLIFEKDSLEDCVNLESIELTSDDESILERTICELKNSEPEKVNENLKVLDYNYHDIYMQLEDINEEYLEVNDKGEHSIPYNNFRIILNKNQNASEKTKEQNKNIIDKTNVFIIFGLYGEMKSLFVDFIDEYYYDDCSDKDKMNAPISVNCKYMTRAPKYYDKYTASDEVKTFHKLNKTENIIAYYDETERPHTGYGIDLNQVFNAHEKGKDHFIICNNKEAIAKTILEIKKKNSKIQCAVINIEIPTSSYNIIDILIEKYKKERNEIGESNDEYYDLEIKKRIDRLRYKEPLTEGEIKKAVGNLKNNAKDEVNEKMNSNIEFGFDSIKLDLCLDCDPLYNDTEYRKIYDIFRREFLKIIDEKYALRFDWRRLLTDRRIFPLKEKNHVNETDNNLEPFVDDYDTISTLASFRRLQDKCQVFPLKRHDYARTRLTHSIEVAATAEELGEKIISWLRGDDGERNSDYYRICRAIPIILRNASLLHDMGNPPFGHYCEDKIKRWFDDNLDKIKKYKITVDGTELIKLKFDSSKTGESKGIVKDLKADITHIEGNAQMLRLVTTLALNTNCNLTMSSICSCIKYIVPAKELPLSKEGVDVAYHKNGYYLSEKKYFENIFTELGLYKFNDSKETVYFRHPLSFLLEAADDISYLSSDLEDAMKRKLILTSDLRNEINKVEIDDKTPKSIRDYFNNVNKELDEIDEDRNATDVRYKTIRKLTRQILLNETIEAFKDNYDSIMTKEESEHLGKSLIEISKAQQVENIIRGLLKNHVYHCDELVINQIKCEEIINTLLTKFLKTSIEIYNNGVDYREQGDIANSNIMLTFSKNYLNVFKNISQKAGKEPFREHLKNLTGDGFYEEDAKLYFSIMLAMDQICGMTDSYAIEMYHIIKAKE